MTKVLYVMGPGHSGSTFLNIALGNHPQVEGVGELCNLHRIGWREDSLCSCGRRVQTCPLYGQIKQDWEQSFSTQQRRTYLRLQHRFESMKSPRAMAGWGTARSAEFPQYAQPTAWTLNAIAQASGKTWVADASKSISRALALAAIPEIDFYAIHLVRDVRAAIWSRSHAFKKDHRKGYESDVPAFPAWKVALSWSKWNLAADFARRKFDPSRSMLLRYEDLMQRPREAFDRIGRLTGLDFQQVVGKIERRATLDSGHVVSGNAMRLRPAVFNPNFDWMDQLDPRSQRLGWMLAGWQMKKYGYQRTPAAPLLERKAA